MTMTDYNNIESLRETLESSKQEVADMRNKRIYPSAIYCRIDPFDKTEAAEKERRRIEKSYLHTMEAQCTHVADRLIKMIEAQTLKDFNEHVLTSEELIVDWDRSVPTYPEHWTEHGTFKYLLTPDELDWLKFIGGRYAIADVINDASQATEHGLLWEVDTTDVAKALYDDGVVMAPCLSEDCALQRLIWFIGPMEESEHEQIFGSDDHRNLKDGY